MTRSTRTALIGVLVAAAGVALVRVLAFVPRIHHADAVTLHDFVSFDRPSLYGVLTSTAHIADPVPYGLIGIGLMAIALLQGRVRTAAIVPVVLLGAAVTTDYILKPALAAHRFGAMLDRQVPDGSFPSGHATASMALALCAIVVASPRWRPYVAALGALFAIAVSYSFLSLGWHYPSDVLGGYLVAAAWTSLGIAAMRAADAQWPARMGREAAGRMLSAFEVKTVTALLAGAVVVAVGLVAAVAPDRAIGFLRVHTIFAVGAAAIALASLTVAGVLAAILRD